MSTRTSEAALREYRRTGDNLDRMLSELYTPLRTATGKIATKDGLPKYSADDLGEFCGRYLGVSLTADTIATVRKGAESYPWFIWNAVDTAWRRWQRGEDVPRLVARDRFRRYGRGAIQFYREHGIARDGRSSIVESLEWVAFEVGAVDVEILEAAQFEETQGDAL